MFKVIDVWGGCYVGGGEYEGGWWSYGTSDGKDHHITYEVEDTEPDTLVNGFRQEIKKLRRRKDIVNKDQDLDLGTLDCVEKLGFKLEDGAVITVEY